MVIRWAAAVAALGLMAGCTSSGSATPSPTAPSSSQTSPAPAGPVSAGPTTATDAAACPYVSSSYVYGHFGQRLGRVTVLRSGGRLVGCRFYALQHPTAECSQTCLSGEHLPGPNQPVVELVTSRYATANAARTAFILASRAGTEASTVTVGNGVPGVVYRSGFVPADRGQDWTCGFATGRTRVLIRSDAAGSNGGDVEVANLARTVLHAL